jgi:2-methylisocitrate lyase-like PEP mutase family enzyme
MNQVDKACMFKALHQKGNPLVLYNVWDAGSARAVSKAGAPAIATGSMAVAAAQGYGDGEQIPLDFVLQIVGQIVSSVDVPVSIDFEGAYASDVDGIEQNVARLIQTGAIGLNFEDQVIKGKGLYQPDVQAARIYAVRKASNAKGVPMVINARTDLFLKAADGVPHASLLDAAIERGHHYAQAGADCYFVPMLTDPALISALCARLGIPVNVMALDIDADFTPLIKAGVARISFGGAPYIKAIQAITATATKFNPALN